MLLDLDWTKDSVNNDITNDGKAIEYCISISQFLFSFAHLGDKENSWITDKCPTTTTTTTTFRQDRCITPALYYTGPILHRPYITPAL